MIKTVTVRWLKNRYACSTAVEAFQEQRKKETDPVKLVRKLMRGDEVGWANWLVTKLLTKKQCDQYIKYTDADYAAAATNAADYAAAAYAAATNAAYAAATAHADKAVYNKKLRKYVNYGLKLLEAQYATNTQNIGSLRT